MDAAADARKFDRYRAAQELILARDQLRAAMYAGRATPYDAERLRAAAQHFDALRPAPPGGAPRSSEAGSRA